MSAYQVLARRWRPQRFEDLVGQEVVVRSLHNAIAKGQIAHAYLFSGLRGVGKTTVARLLAKALNCEGGPTPDPCGRCVSCHEIAAGGSLDVIEMDAASNRGIDDVRELRDVARILPVRDRYRIFILDEAHQLSKDAFAALLKILEEPPAHVVFVLASTEKDKFPATIISRCQQIDFRPIPADTIGERLADIAVADGFTLTPGAARLLARAAEGSLRDALSLLDRVLAFAGDGVGEAEVAEVLGLPPHEVLLSLWSALEAGDAAAALEVLREQERLGRDLPALYQELVQLIDSLVHLACSAQAPLPYPEARRDSLVRSAQQVGLPMLLRLAHLALEQRALIVTADRPGLAASVAIGRLALWPRLQRVESLLAGESPTQPGEAARQPMAAATACRSANRKASGASAVSAPEGVGAEGVQSRLGDALDGAGSHLLAGRVRAAKAVAVAGQALVFRFDGVATATARSVSEGAVEIAEAARSLGLPTEVRIETADGASGAVQTDVRARVEGEPAVQRVLEVFGGTIDRVEEEP
ncbi:MAG: DNA polymerase III subunit gamma/tau [Acidobacteriota bacterium]